MNKEQFLSKLKNRIDILDEKEVEDILNEYRGYFAEKKKKGLTEEETIKEFGDFDELVKEILSAYKINKNYEKSSIYNLNFGKIGEYFNEFLNSCKEIIDNISLGTTNDVFRLIFQIFFTLILIAILRLPVMLIEEIGVSLLGFFFSPLNQIFGFIWRFLIEIVYIIISISLFFNIFKKVYKDKEGTEEMKNDKTIKQTNKKKDKENSINEESNKEETINEEITTPVVKNKVNKETNNVSTGKVIIDVLVFFIKVMLILFSLPAFFTIIAFAIAIFINIALIINGVYYFGILIILIALLHLNILYLGFVFKFVSSKLITFEKVNFKQIIISLIIALITLGVGVATFTFEILNTNYIDKAPINNIITETKEYDMGYIRINYYKKDVEVIIDETLTEKFKLETSYYKQYARPDMDKFYNNGEINYKIGVKRISSWNITKVLMDNLEDKEIYNYNLLFRPKVKVYISSENAKKITYIHDDYDDYDDDHDYDNYY